MSFLLKIVIRIPINTVARNINEKRMKKITSVVLDGR
jgi:hypothetical protein